MEHIWENWEGKVEKWGRDENGYFTVYLGENNNLFVDDGKEATLDALFGHRGGRSRADWWDDEKRYIGPGICMFNNESFERASGMNAIPSGQECNYPVNSTMLVSPEDSFLSREIGQRIGVTPTRRDQTVELWAIINVPGDVPIGTEVREWGIFCKRSGPSNDPSYFDEVKSHTMICRCTEKGTGYFVTSGGTCTRVGSGVTGAVLCYYDDPWIASGDIQLRWKFGEP